MTTTTTTHISGNLTSDLPRNFTALIGIAIGAGTATTTTAFQSIPGIITVSDHEQHTIAGAKIAAKRLAAAGFQALVSIHEYEGKQYALVSALANADAYKHGHVTVSDYRKYGVLSTVLNIDRATDEAKRFIQQLAQ